MTIQEFLTWIKGLVEASAPALAVMFWNYEQTKVDEAEHESMDAKVNLELEKNHESVDAKYANSSDSDIVDNAIASGGGQPESDSTAKSSSDSTDPGQKKSLSKKKATCFDEAQIHALADREKDCEKCKLDLGTMSVAYQTLLKQDHPALQIWQKPVFVVGEFGVAFGFGALVVGTRCFGFCR